MICLAAPCLTGVINDGALGGPTTATGAAAPTTGYFGLFEPCERVQVVRSAHRHAGASVSPEPA